MDTSYERFDDLESDGVVSPWLGSRISSLRREEDKKSHDGLCHASFKVSTRDREYESLNEPLLTPFAKEIYAPFTQTNEFPRELPKTQDVALSDASNAGDLTTFVHANSCEAHDKNVISLPNNECIFSTRQMNSDGRGSVMSHTKTSRDGETEINDGRLDNDIEALRIAEGNMREVKLPSLRRRLCCCLPTALRRNKRLLMSVYLVLVLVSSGLALLLFCQNITIESASPISLTCNQSMRMLSGTLHLAVQNPNLLPIELNMLGINAYFRDSEADAWYLLENEVYSESANVKIDARKRVIVNIPFSFVWHSTRVGYILRRECRLNNIDLAFRGTAHLTYAGRSVLDSSWGNVVVTCNCTFALKSNQNKHGYLEPQIV